MSLSLTFEFKGKFAFFTYNGPQCFLDIMKFFWESGANKADVIGNLIDAFEEVIDETIFQPAQHLIDADKPQFLQAILACTNSMPEILGAATEGYIDSGKNQGGGTRFRRGLEKYILPGSSSHELDKIDSIHYKQIRNPLSHSFVVSFIWLESDGESRYETSEEHYASIAENKHQFENHEALLKHLCAHPYKIAKLNVYNWHELVSKGFKRYIDKLRSGDSLLRDNFMKYITQRADWKSLLESCSDN